MTEAADQATDVLLFYYVGHGLVSADGELHLATVATDDFSRNLAYKALPFSAVREALNGCRARAIVIVLDCCFAGRARGPLGAQLNDGFAAAQVTGSYLLAAAASDEQALAPPQERLTAFSGALVSLLREGDPRGPRWLTLDHVYRYLSQVLPARGLPRPRRHAGGLADDLVLAPNAAYQLPAAARSRRLVLSERDGEGRDDEARQRSPYPGLAAFGPQDARFFFGRESLIADLTARLAYTADHQSGPLAVIGASGCGKSSLLRAGLLPAIERGALSIPGSHDWPCIMLTPGEAPLGKLAAALAAAGHTAAEVGSGLREDPGRLDPMLRAILRRRFHGDAERDGRVILIVDQFEELFARCLDEVERRAFIEVLSAAGTGQAALVVIALRADFYGHCLAFPALVKALRAQHVLVGPMTDGELRDAIEKPASAAGLALQPGLAELLLRDLRNGDGPGQDQDGGALPLLSFALLATWQRRDGSDLTVPGYQETGGIWGAVATEADRCYARLDRPGQRAVRTILLAMVRIGDGTADTKRSADLVALAQRADGADTAAFGQARDELAAARLITLHTGGADITHEALLRAWPRLATWIQEDRAALLRRQRLGDAAAAWQRADRDQAALYRGTLLAAVRHWPGSPADADDPDGLSALEREFLGASIELERAERRAKRAGVRRGRQVVSAVALLVAVALILGLLAIRGNRAATASALTAQSQRFAAQSLAARDTDQQRAALLALAAWQSAHTPAARGSLLSAQLDSYDGALASAGAVSAAAVSPDGSLIATAGTKDRTIRLWDARTHRQVASFPVGGPATSVAFSPDGRILAAGNISRRGVALWDVASHRLIRVLPALGATAVAFSPDGRLLAVGEAPAGAEAGLARVVHLWNPATGTQVAVLPGGATLARSLAFSPDGRLLAAGVYMETPGPHLYGSAQVWDVAARSLLATLPRSPLAEPSVAFSPDGRLLASSGNGQIILWNTVTHTLQRPLVNGQDNNFVAFSPDSLNLLAAGDDSAVGAWDVASHDLVSVYSQYSGTIRALALSPAGHRLVIAGPAGALEDNYRTATLRSPVSFKAVALDPDGHLIATAGSDGAVRLWDAATHWQARQLTTGTGSAWDVAFSPDGKMLASGGADGYVRLWNPATGSQLAQWHAAGPAVYSASFSPDGSVLAAVSEVLPPASSAEILHAAGGVQLWDARTRRLLATRPDPDSPTGLAFDPDGSLAAYGTNPVHAGAIDGQVMLLNPRSLRLVAALRPRDSQILDVTFSPDGQTVAASFQDGTIELWNAHTHRLVKTITAGSGAVPAIAFSPDGQVLAVGSGDGLIRLTDIRTGAQIAQFEEGTDKVNGLAFSRDGQTLVSADADGYVVLWNLDPGRAVQRLCQDLTGPSFAKQWASLRTGIASPPC